MADGPRHGVCGSLILRACDWIKSGSMASSVESCVESSDIEVVVEFVNTPHVICGSDCDRDGYVKAGFIWNIRKAFCRSSGSANKEAEDINNGGNHLEGS